MDNERNRQVFALRDKLASRKNEKLQEQRRNQEISMQKEISAQQKEMDEIKLEQVNHFTLVFTLSQCVKFKLFN